VYVQQKPEESHCSCNQRKIFIHGVVMRVMTETLLTGLAAQVNAQSRVLVLGSMPGVVSLQNAQYYAHPRNRFWPLMATLCDVDLTGGYAQRLQQLQHAGVGLWDVIGQCRRAGSLDAAIVRGSEVVNPLPQLLAAYPGIQVIACNGAAAHTAFQRWVQPALPPLAAALPVLALPSTSPANAAWPLPRLLLHWSQLQQWLQPPKSGASQQPRA